MAVAAVLAWLGLAFARVPGLRGPVERGVAPLRHAAMVVLAGSAVITGVADADHQLRGAVVAVLAAAGGAGVARLAGARRAGPVRVVLVGEEGAVEHHLRTWRDSKRVCVVGLATLRQTPRAGSSFTAEGPPRCESLDELPQLVRDVRAEQVVAVPGPLLGAAALRWTAWALERSPVRLMVLGPYTGVAQHRLTTCSLGGEVGCVMDPPRRSALVSAAKHGVDRLAAAVLLVLLWPVLALLALAVRLDSPGSAFFTQVRVGHDGRPFRMHKLRTMVDGADSLKPELLAVNEADGPLFKIRRDPRTTRIGAILRRTSLDELPQLVNVLRGEMSLIGPRPLLPREAAVLDSGGRRRLVVRPGMTGLWQVSGRSNLRWAESTALDSHYADNWSWPTDLQIAARTVVSVVSGRGAC